MKKVVTRFINGFSKPSLPSPKSQLLSNIKNDVPRRLINLCQFLRDDKKQNYYDMIPVIEGLMHHYPRNSSKILTELNSIKCINLETLNENPNHFIKLLRLFLRGRYFQPLIDCCKYVSESHNFIISNSTFCSNLYVESLLKTNQFDSAFAAYLETRSPNFLSHNTPLHLFSASTSNQLTRVVFILRRIVSNGYLPNSNTFSSVILAFFKFNLFNQVDQILGVMISLGADLSVNVWTVLINKSYVLSHHQHAKLLFLRMIDTGCRPNVVTFTTMIKSIIESNRNISALNFLLDQMKSLSLIPDLHLHRILTDFNGILEKDEDSVSLFHFISTVFYQSFPKYHPSKKNLILRLCQSQYFTHMRRAFDHIEADYSYSTNILTTFIKVGSPRLSIDYYLGLNTSGRKHSFAGLLTALCAKGRFEDAYHVYLGGLLIHQSLLNQYNPRALVQANCSSAAYVYSHISDCKKLNWLTDKIQKLKAVQFDQERHETVFHGLALGSMFETFLETKCIFSKRRDLEGVETVIPGLIQLFDQASDLGLESIIIGVAHNSTLNLLSNVVCKPLHQIFSEFRHGLFLPEDGVGWYTGRGGKTVSLSLLVSPSHLEAVIPVAVGKTRAKQYTSNDTDKTRTMAVLLHGDGSFAGQGVVYETLHLSALPNYTTGGTIHIVLNHQDGLTTNANSGCTSQYCAKALDAPIFCVNSYDVEAVVHAFNLAAEWRQIFHSDVIVDLVCYRRFGHNEIDEPSFKVQNTHPSTLEIYKKKLLEIGVVAEDDIGKIHSRILSILNEEFEESKDYIPKGRDCLGLKSPQQLPCVRTTGVKPEILKTVGKAITTIPEGFTLPKAVKRIYEQHAQMIETEEGIDWKLGEALAFATLLVEGNLVRLSGQDVESGTFSHHHFVVHDQNTGEKYCPLDHVIMNQDKDMFTVSNSSLSEFVVLGFELGYSMENPNSLIIWEAQFGDFANGADVIFDNILASGKATWLHQTGLVVLLPHGYDGQDPVHSSAGLERFLQMADDNPYIIPEMDPTLRKQIQECNLQVVNVTTPANFFHVLRRQIHREFRKPLIVMSPKNLLCSKACRSNLLEFDDVQGHLGFKRLIEDVNDHSTVEEGIRRLVLCSGKIYYELDDHRSTINASDVAICRVEQLCPFPYDLIQRELKRYPNAEVVWCQEEPMNMGGYSYILPRLISSLKAVGRGGFDDVKYVGRAPSDATATSFHKVHQKEQVEIAEKALQREPVNFPF